MSKRVVITFDLDEVTKDKQGDRLQVPRVKNLKVLIDGVEGDTNECDTSGEEGWFTIVLEEEYRI